MQDFYHLTGIKICIYDNTETELCFYPEKCSPFCRRLRENQELDQKCISCDKHAFAECKATHRQYRYICHAGLMECVSPILYGDHIIGYIAIGQIRTQERSFMRDDFKFLSSEMQSELAVCYEKLPKLDLDKMKSAIHILDACTGYEYLKSLMTTSNIGIDKKLDSYINSRLATPLSIQELCSVFRLSRNELYAIFREFFNDSPAKYIKKRRLNQACELLTNTKMPIQMIAQKCGIPDYNYFTKTFKMNYGDSPRTYRKTH